MLLLSSDDDLLFSARQALELEVVSAIEPKRDHLDPELDILFSAGQVLELEVGSVVEPYSIKGKGKALGHDKNKGKGNG